LTLSGVVTGRAFLMAHISNSHERLTH